MSEVPIVQFSTEFLVFRYYRRVFFEEHQFRKGMDKIIELKSEILVSSVEVDYIKLPISKKGIKERWMNL